MPYDILLQYKFTWRDIRWLNLVTEWRPIQFSGIQIVQHLLENSYILEI